MDLIKNSWCKKDIEEFNNYLISLQNIEKALWVQNIYGTQKPSLAIKVPVLRDIAKNIFKGDVESFLKFQTHLYIEDDILSAIIISLIKDYKLQLAYLSNFLQQVDSWVCTDTLKLNNYNFKDAIDLSQKLSNSPFVFERRFAFVQLLKFAKNEQNINEIFLLILNHKNEQEYYVNMAISWLICELMVYNPEKTYIFLLNYKKLLKNKNNLFILKKSISKCQDSFRISNENKIKLKKLII